MRSALASSIPLALVAVIGGCGGGPPPAQTSPASTQRSAPVDVPLRNGNGEAISLADFRGHTLVVLVFATYDDMSQLCVAAIDRVVHEHPELRAIAIAAQPTSNRIVPQYERALGLAFPLSYEDEPRIVQGGTELGPVPIIPTWFVLDAAGRIVSRAEGRCQPAAIEEQVQLAQ